MSTRNFSFLHSFDATGRYWRGLEKAGLIHNTSGIRLILSPFGGEERRFNTVAARGGALHRMVVEQKRPLIVDRLLGGSPYREHKLDTALITEYTRALGDRFLGMQIHEPLCNLTNDWSRLLKADPKCRERGVDASVIRPFFKEGSLIHCLEYGTVDDYAGRRFPGTQEEFWSEINRDLDAHGRRAGGIFTACEGSHLGELAWNEFYKRGARCCMAEVGPSASSATQFMIASLRGAAKAAGKPWGVFFAPWGPQGCTSFIPLSQNAWCVPPDAFTGTQYSVGPEYGPSSALQRRMFFHAYLAGAHYLYEEWGTEDNLLDWDSGELSSYGIATREFLDFQEAHPDVGTPFAPVALVLDTNVSAPVWFQRTSIGANTLRFYPARGVDIAWSRFRMALFGDGCHAGSPSWSGRDEVDCLAPCALPEVYEIVPSDAPADIMSSYRKVFTMGEAETAGSVFAEFAAAVEEYSPFERATDLTMQINQRASDGAWIVGLYNPRGAWRGDVWKTGVVFNDAFTAREVLHPKFRIGSARLLYGWPLATTMERRGDDLNVTVGPGGLAILEILPKK